MSIIETREAVALAGQPGNTWGGRRFDAMLLGQLGRADALGAALWRLKYRGEASQAARAVALMAHRLAGEGHMARAVKPRKAREQKTGKPKWAQEWTPGLLHRLCFRVIFEWVNDRCTTCHGRGSIGMLGSISRCPMCRGSGRVPVLHAVRARDIGVPPSAYRANWERVFDTLLVKLAEVDDETEKSMRRPRVDASIPSNAVRKAA
jgi:cytochrome c1